MTHKRILLQNKPLRVDKSLIMFRSILFIFVVCFFLTTSEVTLLAQNSEDWLKKAQALDKDGFLDEAVEFWEKLATTNTNPNLVIYAYLRLGTTYLKLEQFQKSIDTVQAIVQFHPDNFDVHFHLANSLSALRKFSEATVAYKKTTILEPREGLGYVGLGLSFFGNSDSEKAIEALLKAKKLFKEKKNISWYRDTRFMVSQIKDFAKFPPSFSSLWLTNNLKVVHETYEKAVFDSNKYLR